MNEKKQRYILELKEFLFLHLNSIREMDALSL